MKKKNSFVRFGLLLFAVAQPLLALFGSELELTSQDTLETYGLTVLLFHNEYHSVFGDQKMSGLELILHEQRVATNGDVRLSPTPERDGIRFLSSKSPLAARAKTNWLHPAGILDAICDTALKFSQKRMVFASPCSSISL